MSKALLHGASANLLARVSGLAASFLNIFLLGRLLNIADFGLWAWLFAIYSLITSQDFGYISAMRVRIGRHIQTEKSQQQRLLYTAALLMTIFVLVVVIFGIFGYSFIFGNSTEEERLRNLAIFCSSATILGTVSAQALLAHLHTAIVGLVETLRSIIQIIIYALAYFFNWSLTSLVFCFFITCLIYIPLVTKLYLSTTRWKFS
jgi:O-antigen/teichoic acid export membrane protein